MTDLQPLSPIDAARGRASAIRSGAPEVMRWQRLIRVAWEKRDWETLQYDSWASYVSGEFGAASEIHLQAPQRRELVAFLRAAEGGMSTRAIASAVGVSHMTVARDIQQQAPVTPVTAKAPDETPKAWFPPEWRSDPDDESSRLADVPLPAEVVDAEVVDEGSDPPAPAVVTGTDGKRYTVPPPAQSTRRRRPLPDVARDKGYDLRRAMEAVERVFDDIRYRDNSDSIITALRGHLLYVQETAAAYLDQMSKSGDQS